MRPSACSIGRKKGDDCIFWRLMHGRLPTTAAAAAAEAAPCRPRQSRRRSGAERQHPPGSTPQTVVAGRVHTRGIDGGSRAWSQRGASNERPQEGSPPGGGPSPLSRGAEEAASLPRQRPQGPRTTHVAGLSAPCRLDGGMQHQVCARLYLEVCLLRVEQLTATSCSAEKVASRVQSRLHRGL